MVFGPNDSPLAGRAGKAVTGRVIGERLQAEAETSVSLRVISLPGRWGLQAEAENSVSLRVISLPSTCVRVIIPSIRSWILDLGSGSWVGARQDLELSPSENGYSVTR